MRKVLSYVLILALVLSSFSMAFAGSATELKTLSDVEGNANQEAIEVAYDLGIVTGNPDGTFQPTKAVTRAEFAAMITRALAIPESALAGYAKTNFKDTAGYTWAVPYLAFCNSKGIMLGDGQGNAMPGKTITVNEAVTMVLRALGYTNNSAELVGTWPSNYVTKAQELKLYDDVAKDAVGVDKANAAQIIYNALTVQKVAVNTDGETKKLWDKEPNAIGFDGVPTTLLSSGLNCTAEPGQVVNNDTIKESLINAAKYIGQYGTVYRNDDKEMVAFIADSDLLVGRFTAEDKFVTTDEEKEYTVKVAADDTYLADYGLDYLVNGKDVNEYNSVAAMVAAKDGGKYGYLEGSKEFAINVDLSGKTIKDIYSVVEWTVSADDQVEKADIDEIKDEHELLGCEFVEEDNDEIDYTQFQLVGAAKLSDIKADDVVYVYADGKDIRKIEVGTKTVEGVVKNFKIAKKDAAAKFSIGSETLKNAEEVINGVGSATSIDADNVSDEVKAVLDARGYVYDFDDTTSADNYAVIEKADSGITDQVKLMLADGTEKVFEYDDDADKAGNLHVDTLIGYGLNKSGVITDSNLFSIKAKITLGNKKFIKTIADKALVGAGSKIEDIAWVGGTATIDDKCVVFTYDGEDYDVTTIDKVDIDEAMEATLLFDEDNKAAHGFDAKTVVAMIVPEDNAKSGDKSYAVINEKNKTSNDDGDKVWHIVGYKDGAKMDTNTDDDTILKTAAANPVFDAYAPLTSVEVYEIKVDAKGVITSATIIDAAYLAKHADTAVVAPFVATSVDGRNSVNKDATGYAISEKAVFYKVTDDDEFKVETGKLKEGDVVMLYELDDDEDGYDIVVFQRP